MSWNNTRVLVTGGGGFIGSHLVETLAGDGARVTAFVRYTSTGTAGYLEQLPGELAERVTVIRGDLRDAAGVRAAMEGVDTVFHLGALIAIPYSYVHPRETIDVNVMGTLSVLEAARAVTVRRLVHISTSEVYGTAQTTRIDEHHPVRGQSPYSASKIAADKIAESFYRAFEVPVVTIRPFNTYGPRQSARAVIPAIIGQVLGSDRVQLGALSPTRDFTFVADTVAGMIRGALADGVLGREINLGADQEISIGDLAQRIMALAGRVLPLESAEERLRPGKSEVMRLHSNNQLAADVLGWRPQVSLDDGLRRTIAWYQARPGLLSTARYQV